MKIRQFCTHTFEIINNDTPVKTHHIKRHEIGGGDWSYYVMQDEIYAPKATKVSPCLDNLAQAVAWYEHNCQ